MNAKKPRNRRISRLFVCRPGFGPSRLSGLSIVSTAICFYSSAYGGPRCLDAQSEPSAAAGSDPAKNIHPNFWDFLAFGAQYDTLLLDYIYTEQGVRSYGSFGLSSKSMERITSPEQMNDYIRVSNPSVWMILAAVIVLLIGVCVWGAFGHLDTVVQTGGICEDGRLTVF